METISNLHLGLLTALQPYNLFYCLAGVFLGTFVGVLPGIGATATIAVLLPLTYYLEPTAALILLAGVYYGAEYGGSTASILLNIPGTPSNAVTCLDGYPMTQQGRAGVALFTTAIASYVGGLIGIILLVAVSPAIVAVSTAFGPAEYVAVVLFGLIASAAVTRESPVKGLAAVFIGLLLGCVGVDVNSGVSRFSFQYPPLIDGISLVALAMGIFGLTEIFFSIKSTESQRRIVKVKLSEMMPRAAEMRASFMPMLRGAGIGAFLGALPGTGPTIASFISYAFEKRAARDKDRFGKGAIEGIAGPESANNSAAQTAFIPTLTLGIPGTSTMAMILGALMIHGITPGPGLMREQPTMFWGLVASFAIGNLILIILNIPLIGIWVRMLTIPYRWLYPVVVCLITVGVFAVRNSVFDVFLVAGIGMFGYAMRLLGIPPAPMLVGFILGPLLEENFRRALLLSRGDFGTFFGSTLSASLLGLSAAMLVWPVLRPLCHKVARQLRPQGTV